MTKTKKQLRAEAVEPRDTWSEYYDESTRTYRIPGELVVTDDEPPEGDVVAVLRSGNAHSVYQMTGEDYMPQALNALADMVERDYVRAEDYNDLALLRAQAERECDELRDSRDHWRNVASRHGGKIKQLKHELAQARKYGTIWLEFEGGGKVEIGDSMEYNDKVRRVVELRFCDEGVMFRFSKMENEPLATNAWAFGQLVERPSPLAKDGQPIEVGETLYSLSDGKAWTVDRIDHGQHHPVIGVNRNAVTSEVLTRALKPEWLTHEKPEQWSLEKTLERFWRNTDGIVFPSDKDGKLSKEIDTFAAEIREKLAKEDA